VRAHHLIRKVAPPHRCDLSDTGRKVITALLAAGQADAARLPEVAWKNLRGPRRNHRFAMRPTGGRMPRRKCVGRESMPAPGGAPA
jgi:hypothetical protein